MRILIAHEAPAGGGGVESYLAAIMPALRARGHHVAFFCADARSGQGPTRLDDGPEVFSAGDEGLSAALERVARWAPDVCFSHNMGPLEVDEGLIAIAPVVKMMHGYFGTCISGLKSHAFPRVRPCAREFGPACLGLYFPRRCGQLRPFLMVEQFGWARRQRRLLARYAHVVVASGHMAAEYARHGVPAARLTTVPLFPTVHLAAAARPRPAVPTVLFLGRMTNLKGGDVLIRAVASACRQSGAPMRLELAGSGPAEASWKALGAELGMAVTFHGWVTGEQRLHLLRSASVLAVPSLWPEPFGLVGLEAAAHGVPSVAFDVGGIGDWLKDGVNGRLVREVGSPDALAAALTGVLSRPDLLARLEQGALRAASELGLAAHVQPLETILRRAAAPMRTVV